MDLNAGAEGEHFPRRMDATLQTIIAALKIYTTRITLRPYYMQRIMKIGKPPF
jgi:hypothetical protein